MLKGTINDEKNLILSMLEMGSRTYTYLKEKAN